MISIMFRLPTTISVMVTQTPFTRKAHVTHFRDAKINFVGASINLLPSSKNFTLSLSITYPWLF
jgi:hypothetical protein